MNEAARLTLPDQTTDTSNTSAFGLKRSSLALVALLVGLFVSWRVWADGTNQVSFGGGTGLAVTALLTGVLAAIAAWRSQGPVRFAWTAIGAGCAVWAVGVLFFTGVASGTGLNGRFLSIHIAWAGLSAAFGAGILCLGVPETRPDERRKLILDLTPTVIALIVGVWLAVFGPAAIDGDASWRLRTAAAIHGGGALLLLVVGLAGALRPARSGDPTIGRALSLAAGMLAVADLVWLQPWLGGRTDRSLLAQTGLLIGFLAVAVAALRVMARSREEQTEEIAAPAIGNGEWLQFVPYLSLLALLLLAWGQSRFGELQPYGTETAIVGSLAVVVFVMLRQGLALRQARTMKGEIGHLTEQIDGLIQQVGRDPLTGLLNRRAVMARIDHELAHGRTFGHPVAVVLIDVDNFKTVNDTLGHQAGDRVLLAVGSILTAACRGTDVAARYAGDEFMLVLPGLNEVHAAQVCERIVDDVRRLADELDLGGVRVTLSVGAAVTHRCKRTATQVIAIADAAMYDAKEGGKDRAVAVNADTLMTQGAGTVDTGEATTDLAYLPAPVVRALGERRGRELIERAS